MTIQLSDLQPYLSAVKAARLARNNLSRQIINEEEAKSLLQLADLTYFKACDELAKLAERAKAMTPEN
ncbi:hypothetical protein ACIP66_03015 [Pseudomonas sp. NPDC088429]|uniref:hypothetical protein n=1 Tax=Pseudomonas sp. NPDC088429 TaxID=3364455 RepID=UPI003801A75D